MKTLNEQIQRLRDILHTCYESIARKGGTLPPAGERNMTNLPDAVASVPQVVGGVQMELVATENHKDYLPADYGADAFSKVTTEVQSEKIKVYSFKVKDDCIGEDGSWKGENVIDTSECVNLSGCFNNCTKLKRISANNWDTSNVTSLNGMFTYCKLVSAEVNNWDTSKVTDITGVFAATDLIELDVNNWDVSNVTNMNFPFSFCRSLVRLNIKDWNVSNVVYMSELINNCNLLESLDLTKWEIPNVTYTSNAFSTCRSLQSLVGEQTEDDIINNGITCLKGLKVSLSLIDTILNRASLRALINGLADLTGQTAQTLTLGATLIAKLTDEDIAITTSKNWSIA